MKKGIVLLVTGVIALIAVYSMRPPSNLMDALIMLEHGRQYYFIEPVYLVFMAISSIISILGVVFMAKDADNRKTNQV